MLVQCSSVSPSVWPTVRLFLAYILFPVSSLLDASHNDDQWRHELGCVRRRLVSGKLYFPWNLFRPSGL